MSWLYTDVNLKWVNKSTIQSQTEGKSQRHGCALAKHGRAQTQLVAQEKKLREPVPRLKHGHALKEARACPPTTTTVERTTVATIVRRLRHGRALQLPNYQLCKKGRRLQQSYETLSTGMPRGKHGRAIILPINRGPGSSFYPIPSSLYHLVGILPY